MTYREFRLREYAFRRAEKEEWKKARMIAYYALAATGAISTKKMSMDAFMPLDGNKTVHKGMSESQKQSLREARERSKQQLNGSRT